VSGGRFWEAAIAKAADPVKTADRNILHHILKIVLGIIGLRMMPSSSRGSIIAFLRNIYAARENFISGVVSSISAARLRGL
jgi:hypothetical protein